MHQIGFAGGRPEDLGPLDGMNMWQALSKNQHSPRTEVLINIDNIGATTGLRYENFKLVLGNNDVIQRDYHHKMQGGSRPYDDLEILLERSRANGVLKRFYGDKIHLDNIDGLWRQNATIDCGQSSHTNFAIGESYYVFDVASDPCELHNLAHQRPAVSTKAPSRAENILFSS
ncbi:hypothetical protein HPB48_000993 [Haemaphysalis longicornis]|uniref:Uncharacterized protein n=1 Tax=Haemaphysalis longicornis TaxID=44386 RepID=A0A9J6GZR0_HAELO|nr:hypothetical protein HPB48_000993 [Haemaphysalis longicornis]